MKNSNVFSGKVVNVLMLVVLASSMFLINGCVEANAQAGPTKLEIGKINEDGITLLSFEQKGIAANLGGKGTNTAANQSFDERLKQADHSALKSKGLSKSFKAGIVTSVQDVNSLYGF